MFLESTHFPIHVCLPCRGCHLAPAANAAVTIMAINPTDPPDPNLNFNARPTHQGLCILRAALKEAKVSGWRGGHCLGRIDTFSQFRLALPF